MDLGAVGKLILLVGLALAAFGVLLILVGKGIVPRLPGDISLRLGNVRVFLPIATSIVLSVVITVVINLIARR